MGEVHPLTRPSSFVDPIHGLVRLTEEEMRVIDTPTFQRLRRVKQNGLLHLVFPAATHSRFEHSIGVLACVDAMLQALILNSEAARGRLATAGKAEQEEGVDFSALDSLTLKAIFRVARLAALVHDLGHGPCSHAFDSFAPRQARIRQMLTKEDALKPLRPYVEHILSRKKADEAGMERAPVPHEVMSVVLFAWVWHDRGPSGEEELLLAVCASILGDKFVNAIPEHPLAPWLPLLHDLVASAPVDADRMDYVERDSRSCGVTYGIYDRDRLLKSLLCYRADTPTGATKYRLGWKRSGLRAIENFLQARFQLFVQIYYHKTNHALSLMLKELGDKAKSLEKEIFPETSLHELAGAYAELGDESFLRLLRGLDPARFKCEHEIHAIAEAIERRHLWHRIYESHDGLRPAEVVLQALKKRDPDDHLRLDVQDPKATKDLDQGGALLDRGEEGHYRVRQTVKWTSASPVLKTLEDQERAIARIYFCRTVQAGEAEEPSSSWEEIKRETRKLQEEARRLNSESKTKKKKEKRKK